MEFNKETFEKALKATKIVKYQQHFEALVKSYLEIENQALRQPLVSGMLKCCSCGYEYEELIIAKDGNMKCKDCAF